MHENNYFLVKSANDPKFQTLSCLRNPQTRIRTGFYLIEGIRHVARALEARASIHSVFFDPSRLVNPFGRKLVRKLRQLGVRVIHLLPQLYRRLTRAAEPQGIGAMVRQQWTAMDDVRPGPGSCWLGIESIDSPGNLGTIIRTAEAAGVNGIFVIGQNVDPWDPGAVRSSMGSLFAHKLVRCSAHDLVTWAKSFGVTMIGSSPKGMLNYKRLGCRWPAMLLIGSEKHGLSEQLSESADFMVRIPMLGRGDSINAAVAAGILLYELLNQRQCFSESV